MKSPELVGAMAHEPSDDGPGVLFVLDVEVEERGRDAASTRGGWMRGSDEHVDVGCWMLVVISEMGVRLSSYSWNGSI